MAIFTRKTLCRRLPSCEAYCASEVLSVLTKSCVSLERASVDTNFLFTSKTSFFSAARAVLRLINGLP